MIRPIARRSGTQSAMTRAVSLALVVEALGARNLPWEALFARFGADPAQIQNPLAEVELRRFIAIFEAAADLAHDRLLGLKLADEIHLEQFGPPAIMILAASSLRAATVAWRRYGLTWQSGTRFDLIDRSDSMECHYQIIDPSIWPRRQDTEFSVGLTCRMFRGVMGSGWAPQEVHFEHERPTGRDALRLYHRVFRCPVQFGAPSNRVVLAASDLDSSQRSAYQFHAPFAAHLLHALERETGTPGETIAGRVAALLRDRLGRDRLDAEALATALGLSPRTLQRRLAEEGTSLRVLLRDCRQQAAETMLGQTSGGITGVAMRLGYADSAVLSRAFKHWTGVSPRGYRRKEG